MKILTFLLLVGLPVSASQVRDMALKPQDVGVIYTSTKFSTVVQVNEKPLNVVLGDQSDFRVEFIGNNITIKPLRSGAKTNLFIFTENDRFNLTLVSGKSTEVNYVVKLKRIYDDQKQATDLNLTFSNHQILLTVIRKVKDADEVFLDFRVENDSAKTVEIAPDQFRFVNSKHVEPIRDLYIEKPTLAPGEGAFGSMHLGINNISRPFSIWIGLKNQKPRMFSFKIPSQKGKVATNGIF